MRKGRLLGLALTVVALAIILIAVILSRGTDSSAQLLDAAERGDLALIKSLIQQRVPINQRSPAKFGWTPLIGAIFHNQTNVVEYLVRSGANVNLPDKNGVTPLMWMTGWGDEGVSWVKFLIAHGASLDLKDKYGATVIGYAKGSPPKPELIKALDAARAEQEKRQ